MRRWIGSLHGGQLVMLFVPILLVGFAVMWVGYTFFYKPAISTHAYALELRYGLRTASGNVPPDTARATEVEATERRQTGTALKFIGVGLLLWATTIPMLWWWFGARRRPPD